jgi:hypothetical protein
MQDRIAYEELFFNLEKVLFWKIRSTSRNSQNAQKYKKLF